MKQTLRISLGTALVLAVFLALALFCPAGPAQSNDGGLTAAELRCERLVNPLGIDVPQPPLSWLTQSNQRGQRQTAYRILVASTRRTLDAHRGDYWDSGKILSDDSVGIAYAGHPLVSGAQYFWKVMAWDKDGLPSRWSEAASWTMGLLEDSDWQARWIGAPPGVTGDAAKGLPIFRKPFRVDQPVRRALVHVTGLGHYDLFLNGGKVGDRFLDPAWSVYEKTVYYATYYVTAALLQGENVLGLMLGKGFYNTAGDRRIHGVDAKRPLKLILRANIELADGSRQVVVSNGSWRVAGGPLTHCAILGGSDYDARRLPAGWAEAGFDDTRWSNALQTDGPGGRLRTCTAPPMKVMDILEPIRIDEPKSGVFVYDFGQNASAVPRITVRGEAGHMLTMTPAEQRFGQSPQANDGNGRVNQAGVGKPNYWQYTLRGGPAETWLPPFTYSGFQYVQVTGAVPAGHPNPQGLPVVEKLVSCHVRNAAATVGTFSCSNPLLNDIHDMIDWAVRSNLGHVLTDCPHREKLGWLEVSYLMEPSIACVYDIGNFYHKITRDIRDSQDKNGAIYTVAPNYPDFAGGFRYTPEWGAAGVILPWQIYQRYADQRVLVDNFETMKRFVDYMQETATDLVPVAGLGDWCDYGHGYGPGASRFTPPQLSAMATFHNCTRIVAQTAALLDKPEGQKAYGALADRIRTRFNATYFDNQNEYKNLGSPQTANAMALITGLAPPEKAAAIAERIVEDLMTRACQQTSGDVGFTYLVQALAAYGYHDVLYDVVTRRDLGSYGYFVDHGWTSLPETWDANTSSSMNHCMLGHIQQWLYEALGGIRRAPQATAYKKMALIPQLLDGLTWVTSTYQSVHGTIRSAWEIKERRFFWNVTIPPNTSAMVCVPAAGKMDVREGGNSASAAESVRFVAMCEKGAMFEIGAGQYCFESPSYQPYVMKNTRLPVPTIAPTNGNLAANELVVLECGARDATIRYTLDGTDPTEASTEYKGPFILRQPTVVKACAFMEGMSPSFTATSYIDEIFDQEVNGLNFAYYLGKWQTLPDFDALVVEKTGVTPDLDVNRIKTRDNFWGVRFSAWLDVPANGDYTFYLTSDDGSKLLIDDALVIDNDGAHAYREISGRKQLTAGKHPIAIEYFQNCREVSLGLLWEGPGFGKRRIGTSRFFRNAE